MKRHRSFTRYVLLSGLTGLVFLFIFLIPKGAHPLQEERPQHPEGLIAHVAPPLPAEAQDFIRFMEQELDSSETVGAAYAMVQGGEVLYQATYGVRRYGEPARVDEHTVFRLASVSKGFAGALACILEEDKVFSLDDRVRDLYPGFHLRDSVSTEDMTLRHLLSHSTGLVPYAFDNLVEAGIPLSQIIDRLSEVDISGKPGSVYGYQNVMFSMLDPIIRRSTGRPYEVEIQQHIFGPLGMGDASAGPMKASQRENMAYPHVASRNGFVALDPHEGYYNVSACRRRQCQHHRHEPLAVGVAGTRAEPLSEAVRNGVTTPVIYTPLKARYTRNWEAFQERYYSLGWRIYFYKGRKIMYHGGYIRGYRAEIGFCPEEDLGVVFLQNSPNGLAAQCVPAFFDRYFDARDAAVAGEEMLHSAP
ncbi:MAG: serine hydrolase domain-containing protein [Bacteroidales bacterium]